jgi:hypothetical protein
MDAQTKALKAHRKRLRARGMKRVEVVVPACDTALVRQVAAGLRDDDATARRFRAAIQGAASPACRVDSGLPASALDVFAMTEPLSAEGERLWNEIMEQIERERRDPVLNRPRDVDL